jgi:hypothetical protein
MIEQDDEVVIQIQDSDILEVTDDADALLARLIADGELLTGGVGGAKKLPISPVSRPGRRGKRRR